MSARRMLSSSAWARDQRLAAIGLGVALLLNLALALPRLGDAPFNFNESATAVVLDGPFSSLLERVRDTHPTGPVYFYLLFPWAAEAGLEPGPLRAFSLLFGVATVAMLFVFGASLRLPGLGAVAALLAAAWPYLIWLEHLVRWYTLATFLSVASAWL